MAAIRHGRVHLPADVAAQVRPRRATQPKLVSLSFVPMPVAMNKPGRDIAVSQLHATVTPEAGGYEVTGTREAIAAMIRELSPLSRSERWVGAVEAWAALVVDEANKLSWAYLQGSVRFAYATEGL